MTNKLPEGWERDGDHYVRRDRQAVVGRASLSGVWIAGANANPHFFLEGGWTDPIAAMQALNEKYPLEVKERGKG